MSKTLAPLLVAAATTLGLGLGASPAVAQLSDRVCVVSDPTGTLLNVREEPNGRVVGTIANGVWVWVRTRTNARGKAWAYIHDSDRAGTIGPPLGWVFDAYLKCL